MYDVSTVPVFDPKSQQASSISTLFIVTLAIGFLVVLLVSVLVGWFAFRYRYIKGTDESEPRQVSGNFKIEVIWTVTPFVVLFALFIPTVIVMNTSDPEVSAAAQAQPDVIIIGHQWWWEYQYPKEGITTANVMYIPSGKQILAKLESADVIHDFWVPQLGRKMDNLPGQPNYIYLNSDQTDPTQETVLHGACAEYCGNQHAYMLISVHVVPQTQYDKWVKQLQKPAAPQPTAPVANSGLIGSQIGIGSGDPVKGAQVFLNNTCINCHAIAGTSANAHVGPDLTHLGSREIIGSGVIENTPENLSKWINNADSIKPGLHMPAYLQMSSADNRDLVAYLESLK